MSFDTFLDLEGIEGEATAKGFEKKIEILSCSFGGAAPTSVGPGTGGISSSRVALSSFSMMKKLDKASSKLFQYMCDGTHIPKATLSFRKQTGAAQEPYLVYTLTDCMVSSYQMSGSSGGDDLPTDSFSLDFAKVEIEYKLQKKDGKLETAGQAAWDVTTVSSK
jgi:type VI secretion system secreted protein Hcp